MFGQPVSMLIPDVVGLSYWQTVGRHYRHRPVLPLRRCCVNGVVGKFVEFYGDGLDSLPLAKPYHHRQHGAGVWRNLRLFPIDTVMEYMRLSGRSEERVALAEAYTKAQGMWRNPGDEPVFTSTRTGYGNRRAGSGAKRPQIGGVGVTYRKPLPPAMNRKLTRREKRPPPNRLCPERTSVSTSDGAVVIAAITSCTNTSNPSVLMAAGLLANKAVSWGLSLSRG